MLLLGFLFLFPLEVAEGASVVSDVERVIILSIDSMNNEFVFNRYENPNFIFTPNIGVLVRNGVAFTDAEAVVPTKTTVNHIAMVSGSYAEQMGIAGNYVFDRNKTSLFLWEKFLYPWKQPKLIKADTIFKAMERADSGYTSAVVAGKNFVGRPIWADIQVAPGYLSKTAADLGATRFPEVQYWDAPDEWTMDNVLRILEQADPDIMLVNLAFLDPVQHAFGHGSMESWAALSWADYQVGRLLQHLFDSGKLDTTLMVVTADHGQSNEWKTIDIQKTLTTKGLRATVVADGSFAHIFLKHSQDLPKAITVLEGVEAIDGLWYRESLDDINIRTPYTGDLVISLRPPYGTFTYTPAPVVGTHGGLQQRFVPLIFFGPHIKRGVRLHNASLTDIVPTLCAVTGYPLPRDTQGVVLPVIDHSLRTAPSIRYHLQTYQRYTLSYISVIFIFLAIAILVPALIIQRQFGYRWSDITAETLSHLAPYLLLTASVVLTMTASIFSYVVNLYAIPGIQPDAFLVSMDFKMLGASIVSITLTLILVWYAPLGLQVFLQKLRKKEVRVRTLPLSLLVLIGSQLVYTIINLGISIPYKVTFYVFILFFFGGMGLSYLLRVILIEEYVAVNRRNLRLWTIISGVLNGVFWFYLLMVFLFPNYLLQMGIVSVL